MKKSLLSLALLASAGLAANAASETFEVKDAQNIQGTWVETTYDKNDETKVSSYAHYQPLQSLELGAFTFKFEENGASTKPAWYTSKTDECTIRVYAKSSMTISNDADFNMQSITFNCTKTQGLDADNVNSLISCSAGGSLSLSADAKTLIWNAPETDVVQESVTFTISSEKGVGDKLANIQFSSVVISTEAAEPGEDPDPGTPPVTGDHIYAGLLATSTTCDWTFTNVTLPEGLKEIWAWKNYSGAYYLNGSAYDSKEKKALAGEAYAISPVIDLTEYVDATATWEQACKFQTTIKDLCKFCVREEGAADWTVVEIPAWPELDDKWTWASAGTVDLKEYAGKKIEVAFKYASTEEGADTWRIRNFYIDGNKVGVEAIEAENTPARYYDLNGRAVSADRLDAGIYVEVRGAKARKVIIRK